MSTPKLCQDAFRSNGDESERAAGLPSFIYFLRNLFRVRTIGGSLNLPEALLQEGG